jgi:hypothetical protein
MDIDYDPTETDEDDEAHGTMDFTGTRWQLWCDQCGLIATASDGSAEEHDKLLVVWARHDHDRHGSGNGTLDWEDVDMLINRNPRPGDIVELFVPLRSHTVNNGVRVYDFSDWNGFRARVVDLTDYGVQLEPLDERPDGCGFATLNWEIDKLIVVEAVEHN